MRDAVVDYVRHWTEKTELPGVKQFATWLGMRESKFYNLRLRYGKVNEHNALILRDGSSVYQVFEKPA